LRPKQRTTHAADTIVEESNIRRERAITRSEGYREATTRIEARVVASVEEALVVASPHRQSLLRDDVMEHLESTTWLGRVIALQGLLGLVIKMGVFMQNVNIIPWELMKEQYDFYGEIIGMNT
jgi:hypothetical protein